MARINQGILGGVRGRVGGVTGVVYNGVGVLRATPAVYPSNLPSQVHSVSGWGQNLVNSYNSLLLVWKTNVYAKLSGVGEIKKNSLLRVSNYAKGKPSGIYDCESLFEGGSCFRSKYSISLNSFNNQLTMRVDNFFQTLGQVSTNGVVWVALGVDGVAKMDIGSASPSNFRQYTHALAPITAASIFYVQPVIINYPNYPLSLCPPKIVVKY